MARAKGNGHSRAVQENRRDRPSQSNFLRAEKIQATKGQATKLDVPDIVQVAFETNGKGWIGYLVDLPGAFVRGRSETECLSKAHTETTAWARWLGLSAPDQVKAVTAQTHHSTLCVEDADNEVLLDHDRTRLPNERFAAWVAVANRSGADLQHLFDGVSHPDRPDPARDRRTFLGDCPCTIRDVFDHVDQVQRYYLACLGLSPELSAPAFPDRRRECLARLSDAREAGRDDIVTTDEGERWTIAKAIRRYIWHDRIHARSIVRTLQRQLAEGLIDKVDDPFRFGDVDTAIRTDLLKDDDA